MTLTVVYDANVIHPASLRDLLVRLATTELFQAKWTEVILDEMVSSVLRNRTDLKPNKLQITRDRMIETVPGCLVTGYEPLIDTITLPDANDRHVVAAAIHCKADVIVTSNLADFPKDALEPFKIKAQSPDQFLLQILEIAPHEVITAIAKQSASLKNPPLSYGQILDRLAEVGLSHSVATIRDHLTNFPQPTTLG